MIILGFLVMFISDLADSLFFPTVTELTVEYGDSATLLCNGSSYLSEDNQGGDFRWEAMGRDVAFLQGGELQEGLGYEGRVELLPLERVREGDFSLTLRDVVLNDADLYECIWQGEKTIANVWLKVQQEATHPSSLTMPEGNSVSLPCYGIITKTQDHNQLHIVWQRNGKQILSLQRGVITTETRHSLHPNHRTGDLTLNIDSVLYKDQGEYRCTYSTRSFMALTSGKPESIFLTVIAQNTSSTTFKGTPLQETSSQPIEQMKTFSPDPSSENPEVWGQVASLPWVRIGLITGVLVVTALVLGVLLALHKI